MTMTCTHCGADPVVVALVTRIDDTKRPQTHPWCQDRFDTVMRNMPERVITAVPVEHAGRMIAGLAAVTNTEGRAHEVKPGDVVHLLLRVKDSGPLLMGGKTIDTIYTIGSEEGPGLICDPMAPLDISRQDQDV